MGVYLPRRRPKGNCLGAIPSSVNLPPIRILINAITHIEARRAAGITKFVYVRKGLYKEKR